MHTEIAVAKMVELLSEDDYEFAAHILDMDKRTGDAKLWKPDLIIAPNGEPYTFRWYLVGKRERGLNLMSPSYSMLHVQVRSDPEPVLHDHPWDNMSVVVSGGYEEIFQLTPPAGPTYTAVRVKGETVARRAHHAHRLILPDDVPYCMTMFYTGPKIREWGFWYGDKWHSWASHVSEKNGVSVHTNREMVE